MKNLANCTPREFIRQTNRIRKSVEKWLTLTKIMEIRSRLPDADAPDREEALMRQIQANAADILDAVLEEHPDETAELLCLLCFIDPEDMDNHSMSELLGSFSEMMSNREVMDFFTSLARLGSANTSAPASASASIW